MPAPRLSPAALLAAATLCAHCSDGDGGAIDGCANTCAYADDLECDDGGPGSVTGLCAFGSDCADCGPRQTPSGPSPGTPSTCSGEAHRAGRFTDGSSCIQQGGRWNSQLAECNGGAPTCALRTTREDCWDAAGCVWTNADGVAEPAPRATGVCAGQPFDCGSLLDLDDCRDMISCDPYDTTEPFEGRDVERCGRRFSTFAINTTDCFGITERVQNVRIHPDVAFYNCTRRFGCTWLDSTGTYPAFDGREPERSVCSMRVGDYRVEREAAPENAAGCPPGGVETVSLSDQYELVSPDETSCPSGCQCGIAFDACDNDVNVSCPDVTTLRFEFRQSGDTYTFFEVIEQDGLTCGYRISMTPVD